MVKGIRTADFALMFNVIHHLETDIGAGRIFRLGEWGSKNWWNREKNYQDNKIQNI